MNKRDSVSIASSDEDSDVMLEEFKRAFARLKSHKPENLDNIKLLQSGGLRINKSTLAREAQRSRTTYVNHSKVKKWVEKQLGSRPPRKHETPDIAAAYQEYRNRYRDLQNKFNELQTQMGELVCYIHHLEKEHKVVSNDPFASPEQLASIRRRARKSLEATKEVSKLPSPAPRRKRPM
jgi:hypothetical protein